MDCNRQPLYLRCVLPNLRLQWGDGVRKVRPVPAGGSEASHGRVRGAVVRLHRALRTHMLPPTGNTTPGCVFVCVCVHTLTESGAEIHVFL